MNIHPLFVHFPIGILVLYALVEVCRFSIVTQREGYFEFKTVLVGIGVLTSFVTAATGGMAEDLMESVDPSKMPLVEVHSMYAGITISIFSVLAGAYLFEWCRRNNVLLRIVRIAILQKLTRLILMFAPVIAVLGLVSITITGGLGGAIVYGPDVDPIVKIIHALFFGI